MTRINTCDDKDCQCAWCQGDVEAIVRGLLAHTTEAFRGIEPNGSPAAKTVSASAEAIGSLHIAIHDITAAAGNPEGFSSRKLVIRLCGLSIMAANYALKVAAATCDQIKAQKKGVA